MSDDMSAYREVFLSESAEFLQAMVDGLLALEEDPGDLEPVETVFRGAHSLKGMAAAMGYDATAEMTHKMESLMDTVRKGEQQVDPDLVDLMLRAIDTVKDLIAAESSGEPAPSADEMIALIESRTVGAPDGPGAAGDIAESSEASGADIPVGESDDSARAQADASATKDAEPAGGKTYRVKVTLADDCVLKSVRAYMVLKRLNYMGTVLGTEPSAEDIEDENFGSEFVVTLRTDQLPEKVVEAAVHITDVESAQVEVVAQEKKSAPGRAPREEAAPRLSDTQTVRVSISRLDGLVNLVGEMVTICSRLETLAVSLGDRDLIEAVEDLSRVSTELQAEVMETRMVPVENIFNRFPRMVRDLARDLGKKIHFEMDGLDIELDRSVLDEIGDPLVHLLRNAIDHGIESAEDRVRAGKEEAGLVRLVARRERDHVEIRVSDDGRGMDVDAIWRKAVEAGLCSEDQRGDYSTEDILMFVCEPGFSTARQATKVSGRGVGMDVVKGKIEYLGGTLRIETEPGRGSTFVLTLPLTLAIIQALLTGSGPFIFAIPLAAVSEVVPPDEIRMDTVDGRPVLQLRGGTVVTVDRLAVLAGVTGPDELMPSEREHVVLIDSGAGLRALAVERLLGRREIVIKPLSKMFQRIRGVSGTTVLGDGSIALILDPRSFFAMGEG